MKKFFTSLFLAITFLTFGQANNPDFENLIALSEILSSNTNMVGKDFKKSVEKLRSPNLNHMIDALIAIGNADKSLLTAKFLAKPSELELKYWYVLREIHYNNVSKEATKRNSKEIAKEVLEQNIDSRWLLDNYYYRMHGGIATIYNDLDLSSYNFNLDDLGLKDETEKAIFFLSITNSLTQRFRVLMMMKNYDKLLEYAGKLPSFNGKPYYDYHTFAINDFDWIGYGKSESYLNSKLGNLYETLSGHFTALASKDKNQEMRTLYFDSILSKPQYFKHAGILENDLQQIYNKSKK